MRTQIHTHTEKRKERGTKIDQDKEREREREQSILSPPLLASQQSHGIYYGQGY